LQTGEWRYWFGYALVIATGAWAHLTGVFVAVAHGVVLVFVLADRSRRKAGWWRPLAALVLAGWFTIHLYALVMPQMLDFYLQPGAGTGVAPTEWRSPFWLVSETFRSLGIPLASGWLGLLVFVLAGGASLRWFWRYDHVFLLLAIMPGLLLGVAMYLLGRNLWPRMFFNEAAFLVMMLTVFLLGSGRFLNELFAKGRLVWLDSLPALILCAVFLLPLPRLYQYPKQDYTGARDYVLAHMGNHDVVAGLHIAGRVYNQYYAEDWPDVESVQELEQYRSREGSTWVLYTLPRHFALDRPGLAEVVEREFKTVKVFPGTLGDGQIIVARDKP